MSQRPFARQHARWAAAWGAAIGCAAWLGSASATGLGTALPHSFTLGQPRGSATAFQVDAMGTHRSPALPSPEAAHVVWRRRIAGGIAGNVLVDDSGRIFVAGPGRVSQLGPDGATQYSEAATFSTASAAALLGDGTRAVLTREGHVLGWSAAGAAEIDIGLDAPSPPASSALLPLADGGLLVTMDRWLFEIDASHRLRAHTSLPTAVQHTLLARGNVLVIDQRGSVFSWDRQAPPQLLGSFEGPLLAALADGDTLVGLSPRRGLSLMQLNGGDVRSLARFDAGGPEPQIGLFEAGHYAAMRPDGIWALIRVDAALSPPNPPVAAVTSSQLRLLTDPSGSVAWWAAETPLRIETSPGIGRPLADVICSVPVSLVPAGLRRIVAACSSGSIWLIGPTAAIAPMAPTPQSKPMPSGIRE